MNIILFDDGSRITLKPLTFTRPVAEIRLGIRTIREKWESALKATVSFKTVEYLKEKYPLIVREDNWLVNGSVCPDEALLAELHLLAQNEALVKDGFVVAARIPAEGLGNGTDPFAACVRRNYVGELMKITYPYDIFLLNGKAIADDFEEITRGRKSDLISESVQVTGKHPVFLEEGAVVGHAVINTNGGPVYIGKEAEVMEGCLIRGPLALCEHAVLNMGTKIYGATTLGPYCKCGGELNNVVLLGYSNKAHDGFMGNAVVGEWCNFGAGFNNSNLKNTYQNVKLWDYETGRFRRTGLQFCGMIVGDHTKLGISSMINTGTVIGVGANIYGSDFPRNFIPSFSWGGAHGYQEHGLRTFFTTAALVMERRGKALSDADVRILEHIFEETRTFRHFYTTV